MRTGAVADATRLARSWPSLGAVLALGALQRWGGCVPARPDGGAHKVLCSTDICASLQHYQPKRHVFGAEVAMKLLSSLLLVAIAAWGPLSAASARHLPGAGVGGGVPSKMIECCACFDYRDVQTGCDNRDCPACPVHRQFPSQG